MFLGNAARTGEMPGPGPEGEPGVRWRRSSAADEEIDRSVPPLAADGVVFVRAFPDLARPARGSLLVALDPVTGQERWRAEETGTASAVADGLVFVGRGEEVEHDGASSPAERIATTGAILAYDAGTGEERWRFDTDAAVRSPLAVADGVVYAAALDGTIYALDAEDGVERWVSDVAAVATNATRTAANAAPAVAEGAVYVGTGDAAIVALDATTGAERRRAPTGGGVVNTPVVAAGVVFATGDAEADPDPEETRPRVVALDAATGSERWARDFDREARFGASIAFITPPADAAGDVIVAGPGDGAAEVLALDPVSGEERWRFAAAAAIASPPAVVGDTLYVGSHDAHLYALDATTGDERWRVGFATEVNAAPAVSGGALFVTGRGGTLSALGGSVAGAGTPAASPLPAGDASGLAPCDVEPRPEPTSVRAATPVPGFDAEPTNEPPLTGTPVASLVPVTEAQRTGLPPGARPEDLPRGEPADPAVVAAIAETRERLGACSRPGRERHAAALYSDDFFRRPWVVFQLRYGGYPEGRSPPVGPLADVRVLPDGRVGVLDRDDQERASFLVFVERDGRWLIDEVLEVSANGEPPR